MAIVISNCQNKTPPNWSAMVLSHVVCSYKNVTEGSMQIMQIMVGAVQSLYTHLSS